VGWLTRELLPGVPALRRPVIQLFLTSALILFVELILIRWIPANVTHVGLFRNFLLMGSFLGIGAGILFGRDPRRLPLSPFALILFATVALVGTATFEVRVESATETFLGIRGGGGGPIGSLVIALLVVLASILMAALALPLGPLLTSMPPLRAYAVDICGSMAGISAFTVLSSAGSPPPLWFGVVGAVLGLLAAGSGVTRWSALSGVFVVATITLSILQQASTTAWSPYYRVSEQEIGSSVVVSVNGVPHQILRPAGDARNEGFYEQVYSWFPDRSFERLLIVGAGTGTDVAVALAHGAGHVDAVEIDPYILEVGVRRHPDLPYDDPRVTRFVDDGRAFLSRSQDDYDLIVFALPDSLTLVSTSAGIRLESFLFTDEAFLSVKNHLSEDGVFVLYNYYREPWLVSKIAAMLHATFGNDVLVERYAGTTANAATFATGPGVAALAGLGVNGVSAIADRAPRAATDDWPFLYLREPGLPQHYVVALAAVLIWGTLLVGRGAQRSGTSFRRFSPHFFVLGIAFLLLETRSIVTFSLLFGTTWLVNALVFFAVLASVLLAILVTRFLPRHPAKYLYAALLGSVVIAYLLPPASLLIEPPTLRYAAAAALAFAPIFFANLVFSYSFRDTRTADMAFASNLLGAMVGGAVEYLALITGYQALLLVVGALYIAALLLATRMRLLADTELASTTLREQPNAEAVLFSPE